MPLIWEHFVILFDGVCDQSKELETLSGSMPNDAKWIISSSGQYMFVRFAIGSTISSTGFGFSANLHYGRAN